ncbi:MAG TPA: serine hydrolase domain-containing protein [Chloroflexota bacterium]
MRRFIERGVIAGAVTLVGRHGQLAHVQAHGSADLDGAKPMRIDSMFRLASMTKPVISVAVLMLLEEGHILLNDTVTSFIPEFKGLQVQHGPGYTLVPAQRDITIRDLLTHTSGLGSATLGPAATQAQAIVEQRVATATLASLVPEMAKVPLSFQPGTAWEYSGAFGFDTLGRIVEIVSGMMLDEFLRQRLFEPLGMRDTTFTVDALTLNRVATVYERGPQGLQAATPQGYLARATDPHNTYFSGGGGLVGTADDYSRFGLMLAGGGKLAGERILSRKTVDLMASNHIGQLQFDRTTIDLRGYRFGLGVRVLDTPADATTLASRGTFGWAGAFGTNSWIDPLEGIVGLMLIQRMPDVDDQVLRSLWPRFQATAYQALDD